MKSRIFMYLFVFTLLVALFMYMNHKKIDESRQKEISGLNQKVEELNEDIEFLRLENADLNYFTLQGNDNAMTYFEDEGYNAKDIEQTVTEQIYSQNTRPEGNPLIPYAGMEGSMKVNKVRFLNHKWVLADFTDGRYWGEIILQYNIDADKNLTLTTLDSFLYPLP